MSFSDAIDIGFIITFLISGVILVNGWTDAPNAIATCVSTRCLSPKKSIIMAAVFNFLGVFVIGGALIGGCTAGLIATIKNRPQQEDNEN
jgi:phosphate/sulfate permease